MFHIDAVRFSDAVTSRVEEGEKSTAWMGLLSSEREKTFSWGASAFHATTTPPSVPAAIRRLSFEIARHRTQAAADPTERVAMFLPSFTRHIWTPSDPPLRRCSPFVAYANAQTEPPLFLVSAGRGVPSQQLGSTQHRVMGTHRSSSSTWSHRCYDSCGNAMAGS